MEVIFAFIGCIIVLGVLALRHLAKATAADPLDIEGAPEAEADRRRTIIHHGDHTTFL